MSFQDLQSNGGRSSSSSSSSSSKRPSQGVAAAIFQINTAVAAFRRLVDAMGTAKDTLDHRQKLFVLLFLLHNTRQRILQLVKETSAKLKTLSEFDRDSNVDPSKKVEDAKLARDFQTLLQEFQKVQQLATERESTYSPSVPPSSSATPITTTDSPGSGDYMVSESQPFVMAQKRQEILLLHNEIAFNEAVIEERDQGLREIQEQIGQANEIFKDLAVLVHEQGVVIDDVHSNIESSSDATTHARTQLDKASKSVKTKSSWVSCEYLCMLLSLSCYPKANITSIHF
ncbi:hypothetical protein JRO89_XS01G0203600 [Xanthoceras sorbifolium]|uniref:t-SNARE coiled-coil homology domain-containing protein n=1 Tax=Xanthoceras sorbifolium TaxID=99658 RepID=A0ABQ8IK87_9ROSI|nr:hypothetical protein JRO89_XS01G0203600 [Xanthoceras sorbifolium]